MSKTSRGCCGAVGAPCPGAGAATESPRAEARDDVGLMMTALRQYARERVSLSDLMAWALPLEAGRPRRRSQLGSPREPLRAGDRDYFGSGSSSASSAGATGAADTVFGGVCMGAVMSLLPCLARLA